MAEVPLQVIFLMRGSSFKLGEEPELVSLSSDHSGLTGAVRKSTKPEIMMETGTAGEGGGYSWLSQVHNSLPTQINNEDVEKKKKGKKKSGVLH